MAAPTIPLYTGVTPNRTQSPNDFADNADDWLNYQSPLASDYNGLATYLDALSVSVDESAADAEQSAVDSAVSATESAENADLAASLANLKGNWSDQTGAANKPYSVAHKDAVWGLLNDLADVTLSEPSVTADWIQTSGTMWQNSISSNFTIIAGKSYTIDGSGNTVDASLPAIIEAKQEFVIHNEANSTNEVRVLNPNFTIIGKGATLLPGDNLVLEAGDTAHIIALSSSIMEFV